MEEVDTAVRQEELVFHTLGSQKSSIDENQITSESWIEHEDDLTFETVCGIDQRQKVLATKQMPYMAICKLYMQAPNGLNYVGSGWLTAPDRLYTAGHCVYNQGSGGWKSRIIVVPGKSGLSEPYGRYEAVEVMAVRAWIDSASTRYDMGAIKLNKPVVHGQFITPAVEDPNVAEVCGYPADRDNGIFQYRMSDNLIKNEGRFYYQADTFGGQSGSPLLRNRSTAVGIHNYGGCPNKSSDLYQEFIDGVAHW
ncbi:trypsin-like serine peptidase [Pseudozobellia thermophila]|uniref:Serine protease n=1 Tax=Pseudozobellia thermophila TaxID=192903 RepID=A0A1M6M7Q6_9FLAO|nr:trypsin-like serine protease [Pseudozobellia thermophila]SHJ79487.1 V8-like Glu-specific endopeptidase [Pseudozobellia thermophila]